MMTANAMLPHVAVQSSPTTLWFCAHGCVVEREGELQVFVGGALVGTYAKGETTMRNVIVVGLAADRRIRFGRLASAFGMSGEQLRRIRRQYERDGVQGIMARAGGWRKLSPALRRRLLKLFDEGATVSGAHMAVRKRVSRAAVGRVRQQWTRERDLEHPAKPPVAVEASGQVVLSMVAAANDVSREATSEEQPGEEVEVTGGKDEIPLERRSG